MKLGFLAVRAVGGGAVKQSRSGQGWKSRTGWHTWYTRHSWHIWHSWHITRKTRCYCLNNLILLVCLVYPVSLICHVCHVCHSVCSFSVLLFPYRALPIGTVAARSASMTAGLYLRESGSRQQERFSPRWLHAQRCPSCPSFSTAKFTRLDRHGALAMT